MENRRARRWGLEARGAAATATAAPRLRNKYAKDFKAFYCDLLAQDVVDKKSKLSRAKSLGKLHDLLIDFLNLTELADVKNHSCLAKYLPQMTQDGDYHERWLYFRTLESEPEIQDGPVGPISQMFAEKFWQGVIVRIRGDGLTKCILVPRGHLKSTLCTQGYTQWRICRDPSERHLIRSLTSDLAKAFVGDIKFHFESNDKFREVYGDLGPPEKGEGAWNADGLQLRSKIRRGKEFTLMAKGMESEITGGHYDAITLDDVVGESNTKTPTLRADACLRIQRLQAVADPGTPMTDVGTRWEEDDAHSMFLDSRRASMADDSSFIVATVLDADESVRVSQRISPLGYGKPLWPERFSLRAIEKIRRGMPDDRIYFGQYFNQFQGTSLRTFHRDWIRRYEGIPEDCARENRLNIYVFFDTASGKQEQQGKLDYTAGIVVGQTQDRKSFYILDGFKEKLPASLIAKAIADLSSKWQAIAAGYSGSFRAAVEDNAYTNFLSVTLEHEFRERGVEKYVSVDRLVHNRESKADRIRVLAQPYSEFRIFWPKTLFVRPYREGEPYDVIRELEEEFTKWPSLANEDLLDGHAGAFEMTLPVDFKAVLTPEAIRAKDPSVDSREAALKEAQADERSVLGDYGRRDTEWEYGL